MRPIPFSEVTMNDSFWRPRMDTNRKTTIPIQFEQLKKTGCIDAINPDYKPGDKSAHHIFWDSDVAKWMETASYSLQTEPDPALEQQLDEVIASFAKLQREDGYINSWYTPVEPEKRWTNLRDCHELYCAGHLMEAAVAHYQATGKRHFLDIMCRYADYIDSVFGPKPDQLQGYPGHEEIELALMKLHYVTGEERYATLAKYFIDQRGQQPHYFEWEAEQRGEHSGSFPFGGQDYHQAHVPVREQTKVVGHAVRAMYLYCGMVDTAQKFHDPTLLEACEILWKNVCLKQMYVTGGIGPSRSNEGFTFDYDLPEETAYCETCAAIGLILWNHRLLQLTGEGRFADIMERALYNGALSGVSLSGDRFFYVNPLASLGDHHRQPWFGCACCPGNISRLIASIGSYVYSQDDRDLWIHLYAASSTKVQLQGHSVGISQTTNYPWEGSVRVKLSLDSPLSFALHLRIPEWCREASLHINGKPISLDAIQENGYVHLDRLWQDNDEISLDLAMPVERIYAHPSVRMANGKIALQRGPIVYCLEQADNPDIPLSRLRLPASSELETLFEGDLLGGVVTLQGPAELSSMEGWDNTLYSRTSPTTRMVHLKAVPYNVWDNREPGAMLVWLRE